MIAQPQTSTRDSDRFVGRNFGVAEGTVEVQNRYGLHTGTAPMVAKTAIRFLSNITIGTKHERTSARSVLGLTALGAGNGSQLRVRAEGPDAEAAIHAMQQLFASKFGER